MIHIGERTGVFVGNYCSIAHRATLHGCHVEDNALVGIGATVMDGGVIGKSSVVASHALVPPGTIVPPCSVVMGVPGRVVRRHDSFVENRVNAFLYWRNAMAYAAGHHRPWEELAFRDELERERKRLQAEGVDARTAQSR